MNKNMNNPLETIDSFFSLNLHQTIKGDQFKGWKYVLGDHTPECDEVYLNRKDCLEIAAAFLAAAEMLKE